MPKGPNGQKRPADCIGMSVMVARVATGEVEDTKYAPQNRRKSGIIGAKARNESLSAERRREIAEAAASSRWNGMESVMNQNIENAARDLFTNSGRRTRDIKYFFRAGDNTAVQLADYRNRSMAQIEARVTIENVNLDISLLD
jgi:hypothetical protein